MCGEWSLSSHSQTVSLTLRLCLSFADSLEGADVYSNKSISIQLTCLHFLLTFDTEMWDLQLDGGIYWCLGSCLCYGSCIQFEFVTALVDSKSWCSYSVGDNMVIRGVFRWLLIGEGRHWNWESKVKSWYCGVFVSVKWDTTATLW